MSSNTCTPDDRELSRTMRGSRRRGLGRCSGSHDGPGRPGPAQRPGQEQPPPRPGPGKTARPPRAGSGEKAAGTGAGRPPAPPAKKSAAARPKPRSPGPRPSDVDVRVRTRAEMAKPKSPFLGSPGVRPRTATAPTGPSTGARYPPGDRLRFSASARGASSSCTSSTAPAA